MERNTDFFFPPSFPNKIAIHNRLSFNIVMWVGFPGVVVLGRRAN